MKVRRTLAERFWSKVDKRGPDECWPWTGATQQGYGYLGATPASGNGPWAPQVKAHRLSYELHKGPIPEGRLVRHSCDNPPCVNPAHLLAGTIADNMRDKAERGREYDRRGARNPNAKLTPEQVAEIRRRRAAGETQQAIADAFGISQPHVSELVRRVNYVT